MKILLVDNNTKHLKDLKQALTGHEIDIQTYQPGINFNTNGKDLVVLSGGGGEGYEMHDTYHHGQLWYEDQIQFVRQCQLPIVGICMGFEVIAKAHGSEVKPIGELIEGFKKVSVVTPKTELEQFEAHSYCVREINHKEFDLWAYSPTGVEMIRHKTRPIIATQFHPEKGGTLDLRQLLLQI